MMSESAPPAKRKRQVDDESLPGLPQPLGSTNTSAPTTRSTSFWQPKGDIVLEADKTQFRVYRKTLGETSMVLGKMFNDTESAANGVVDGCPRILLNHSKEDVEILLEVTFQGKRFFKELENRPTTAVLEQMLRVANDFKVFTLRQGLLALIKDDLPHFEWGSTGDGERLFLEMMELESVDQELRETFCENVYLAQVQSMRSVCRAAYWMHLASSSKAEITAAFSSLSPDQHAKLQFPEPATALRIREDVRRTVVKYAFAWLKDNDGNGTLPTQGCESPLSCTAKKVNILAKLVEADDDMLLKCALTPFGFDCEQPMGEQFCWQCGSLVDALHTEGQMYLWVDFFKVYGLNHTTTLWSRERWYYDDEDPETESVRP